MTNIVFPKTDLVKCVFSFRASNTEYIKAIGGTSTTITRMCVP